MSKARRLGLIVLAMAMAGCGSNEDEGNNSASSMLEEEMDNADAMASDNALDVLYPDQDADLARPDPGEWKEPANEQGGQKGPP